MKFIIGVLVLVVGATHGALPLPSYIKPCARSDPKFNECARKHAQEVIPEMAKGDRKYKIQVLDPLEITELKVDNTGPRNSGFGLTLRDIKYHGLKDAKVEAANFDFEKQHVHYDLLFPQNAIIGKYEIAGQILVLPITGKGDINITIVNNKVSFDHDYILETRGSDRFAKITNPKIKVAADRVYMNLTNLFNGDKFLGKQMNDFLNENWQDVFQELSPPIAEAISQIMSDITENVAGKVPFDIVFPEKLS